MAWKELISVMGSGSCHPVNSSQSCALKLPCIVNECDGSLEQQTTDLFVSVSWKTYDGCHVI